MKRRSRLTAFIVKEARQMMRDRSTLTLGIILPALLLLLFGYGLSLDVTLVPVAVVRDSSSPAANDLYLSLSRSRYFAPVAVRSMQEAEKLLSSEKVDAIVRRDFTAKDLISGDVQVILNGRDANKARIMEGYITAAIALWAGQNAQPGAPFVGQAVPETRVWYNHAMESRYFLVPGVVVLVMTLIGSLLTALIMAREWERGTFEALLATPITVNEIVLGKIVPYFCLGMAGLCICLATSTFLFGVPLRGSLILMVTGSALYLLLALGIGLFISATVKNQFLSSQIVLLFCFLPTLMLSGFIFDLGSAPMFIYVVSRFVPATWYVELLQTLFLVGDIPQIIVRDFVIMGAYAVLMLFLARRATKKSLE